MIMILAALALAAAPAPAPARAAPAKAPVKAAAAAPAAPMSTASTPAERAFFAKTAKTPGVIALPGLAYEVMKSGPTDGRTPGRGDQLSARYKGMLMDGTVFDETTGDATIDFQLGQVIPGWQVAMKLMRPGDKWRIYIPAYLAYGPAAKPKIPADSPLVFEVELVSLTPPEPR